MSSETTSVSCSPIGCLFLVLGIMAIWAIHYGLSCDTSAGVALERP